MRWKMGKEEGEPNTETGKQLEEGGNEPEFGQDG
jgi:hypothetical protein